MSKQDQRAKAVSVSLSFLSSLKDFKNIFALLTFLFAASLSFQTGFKVDTSQAYVFGFLTDYFIFSIHFSDIIILIFSALIIYRYQPYQGAQISVIQKISLLLFLVLVLQWLFFSQNPKLIYFGLFNILIFFLTILCIYLQCLSKKSLLKTIHFFALGLVSGLIVAVSIGLIQFSAGNSPDIPIFGSYKFSSQTPNIALGSVFGHDFLRAYGTTPHPNIFGALLVFGIGFILFLIRKTKIHSVKIIYSICLLILLLGLGMSFSRTASAMLIVLIFFQTKQFLQGRNWGFLLFIFALALLAILFISGLTIYSKSVVERFELNLIGLKIFFDNPIFGVGINNYLISAQSYFFQSFNLRLFQPPHNLVILFLSQFGIIGLVSISIIIHRPLNIMFRVKNEIFQLLLIPLFLAFVTGSMFDHYFMTQFQPFLLVAALTGFILGSTKMLDFK